jgi:hypothetical protein
MTEKITMAMGVIEAGDGSESFDYREVDTLENMTLEQVELLWDLVPTEDRDFLTRRYRKLLKKHQIGSDEQEKKLADEYLERYRYEGLLPAGEQWVRLSSAKRLEMKRGETDVADVDEDDSASLPLMNLAVIGMGLFLLIFLGTRVLGAGNNESALVLEETATPTPTVTATFTPSPIPSITPTPTPTPIALVESDRFIEAGDGQNRAFFPVQFQILRSEENQPRVFIVQERLVNLTEWVFDPNPDVVSWISHTNIRPILGIPYSEANDTFIRSLGPGSSFVLRMNTGVELTFRFSSSSEVGRQDTHLFQQIEPGIVLVLIGELDEQGLPTSTRYVVSASYDPENDINLAAFNGLPARVGEWIRFPSLSLMVNDTYIVPVSENSSSEFMYAVMDVTLSAHDEDVALSAFQWVLDVNQARYSPDLSLMSGLAYLPIPPHLAAGESIQASIAFLVSRFEGDAVFLFAPPGLPAEQIIVPFNPPSIPLSLESLDVQLRRISRDARSVYVDIRVYNPHTESIALHTEDVGIIFGFTPNPSGPTQHPLEFETVIFETDSALDMTFAFDWNADDPFATLSLAGRVWSIQLVE